MFIMLIWLETYNTFTSRKFDIFLSPQAQRTNTTVKQVYIMFDKTIIKPNFKNCAYGTNNVPIPL